MRTARHGHATDRNGVSRTYKAWQGMLQRCLNPNEARYKDYGGRGISVCAEWGWSCFDRFLSDMGECPEGHMLDRKDVNGDYCKENCRWVTPAKSAQNKRLYRNNSSGQRGVTFEQRKQRWHAYGRLNGKLEHLGYFSDFEDAKLARLAWEATNCFNR